MSALTKPTVANIYNPQNQTKEELIAGFVVRQSLFRKLFKVIKEAKMETPEQHYLIIGRRGMGKTTLLLRLAYEIENDHGLNTWLIPLVFNEEEYGIRSLFKFWERVMELLEEKHPAFRFEEATLRQLNRQFPTDHDAYEKALFDWLSTELTRNGKKLILFADNFGDMASKLSDPEAHRLRKILQTSTDIRLFAASSVVLEAFYKYEHAFYEFFKQVELKGLDEKETREVLLALSNHYKKEDVQRIVEHNPGRVEALRRITGGVIRSIVLLFEIFADDGDGSAFHDLQVILDRTSPLYKHRMDDLSDQQQAIVEAIALNWDAISVKEIAEQTRLESKVVSAQLNSLEKNGIIEKRATRTKNHLYLVAERFFNIWFLMRLGRKADQKRVLWLVRFFEEWCDKDMLKHRAERHLDALGKGVFYPESAFYTTEALAATKDMDPIYRHRLLTETKTYLAGMDMELAQALSASDLEIAMAVIENWYGGKKEEAMRLLRSARPFETFEVRDLLENNPIKISNETLKEDALKQWDEVIGNFACDIGRYYYIDLHNNDIAQKAVELAANFGHANAMYRLGWLYQKEHKDLTKAEEWYFKAAEKSNVDAMASLGWLYLNKYKDLINSEKWYLKAASKGHVGATNNLGWFYQKDKRNFKKAKEWYLKAGKKGSDKAMNNLGELYQNEYKDLTKAEEWYVKAVENGSIEAMNNLGWLYQDEHEDLEKAEEWYLKAVEKGNSDAMWYLGSLFQNKHKNLTKAEEWYIKAAEKDDVDAMNSLGWLYINDYKDLAKAEEWYLKAADLGESSGCNALAWFLFERREEKGKALEVIAKAYQKDSENAWYAHTYACILLWHNRLTEALTVVPTFLWNQKLQEEESDAYILFLTLLLAKNQQQALYDLFNSSHGQEQNFKDRYKPIWYAILKKLDHPDFLRMGDELTQTVDEILAKAEQLAE